MIAMLLAVCSSFHVNLHQFRAQPIHSLLSGLGRIENGRRQQPETNHPSPKHWNPKECEPDITTDVNGHGEELGTTQERPTHTLQHENEKRHAPKSAYREPAGENYVEQIQASVFTAKWFRFSPVSLGKEDLPPVRCTAVHRNANWHLLL